MIYISLGANLPSLAGGPLETLRAALGMFPDYGLRVVKTSGFYRTSPVPASDQPDFINAVAATQSALSAEKILDALMQIEQKFGRIRAEKNAARSLDLDLIDAHGKILNSANLILPHPRLAERAFVLRPLADVAPEWVHPVTGKKLAALMAALPNGQRIERAA